MELLSTTGKTTAVIPFGEASIFRMGVFVDAVVPALKAENLRGVLDMYICVCRALEYMENSEVCSSSDDRTVMISSLSTLVDTLSKAISSTTEKVMTVIEEDDSWAIEILQGRGLRRWVSASKLAKFEFWKVPDPQLRDVLRRAITDRVVSGHRDYLNDHPELAEDVYLRNSTPEVVEEMFVTAI
ncbi:hypothetical protein ACQ4PT_050013 [Festuca glaucescens]